jgi:NAD(P)-dependent dehydrogenase (short-subunit alcohol dehydrogenase family)
VDNPGVAGRFAGKNVVVAGGTGGLGQAVSVAFLHESANVFVTYRNQDEFKALRDAAGEHEERLAGAIVDVTDESAVRQWTEHDGLKGAPVDVLVNAVGAYAGGLPVWQTDGSVLDRMLDLNLRSGFVLSRILVPGMLARGSGTVVNVASRAAFDHAAGAAAYAASKAAAVALMNCLAADVKGTGVRVNSVLPGIIDTNANRSAMPNADYSKWPKPSEIARVVLFLCSEEAHLISGTSVPVYGDA